jgi:hypothetical protein
MTNAPALVPAGAFMLVGRGGVEPPTYHFSGDRSYQLSYLPEQCHTIPEVRSSYEGDGNRERGHARRVHAMTRFV